MIPTIVFDIDGTLSNVEQRQHLVSCHPKRWDEFFSLMSADPPKKDIVALAKTMIQTGSVSIVYCTGRSDEYRQQTEEWLQRHVTNGRPVDVRMRRAGDHRPDDIVKKEQLDALRKEGRYVWFWVEDRGRVVEMLRRNGVTVFQCDTGDFNPLYTADVKDKVLLTLMVGPSGGGKSTFVERTFDPDTVLSSDTIRGRMTGDFKDQSVNAQVFSYIKDTIVTRCNYGIHTVVDATHLRKADRLEHVSLVPAGAKVRYIVVDRPLDEKLRDGGWRLDVVDPKTGLNLVAKHDKAFRSALKDILKGDGLENVEVVDTRTTV